jgi:hypothetical protein
VVLDADSMTPDDVAEVAIKPRTQLSLWCYFLAYTILGISCQQQKIKKHFSGSHPSATPILPEFQLLYVMTPLPFASRLQ